MKQRKVRACKGKRPEPTTQLYVCVQITRSQWKYLCKRSIYLEMREPKHKEMGKVYTCKILY
nr:hypothetical protein Itr_chr12CG19220 [Ipomoea trifida]